MGEMHSSVQATAYEKQNGPGGAVCFDSMVAGARYFDWKQTRSRSSFPVADCPSWQAVKYRAGMHNATPW
jgi:hypothetical protein